MPRFIDCLTDDELKALCEYHLRTYPGVPLAGIEAKQLPPVTVHWEHPVGETVEDVGRAMSRVEGEVSPNRTEGIR